LTTTYTNPVRVSATQKTAHYYNYTDPPAHSNDTTLTLCPVLRLSFNAEIDQQDHSLNVVVYELAA